MFFSWRLNVNMRGWGDATFRYDNAWYEAESQRLKATADALWDEAEKASDEAGYPYKGRDGNWVTPALAHKRKSVSELTREMYKGRVQAGEYFRPQTSVPPPV